MVHNDAEHLYCGQAYVDPDTDWFCSPYHYPGRHSYFVLYNGILTRCRTERCMRNLVEFLQRMTTARLVRICQDKRNPKAPIRVTGDSELEVTLHTWERMVL